MIIHLDQKDWIGLARRYYGVDPDAENIAKQVVHASKAEKAIFPLSITHFDETMKRLDDESRQRLAKYMVTVSKGWAILPATRIIDPEIEDACLKSLRLPREDLQKLAIKKGLSQLMGGKAELEWKTPPPPGLNEELLEKIESPETLLMSLEHGFGEEQLGEMQGAAEEGSSRIEQIRKSQSEVDNDLRHRATLAQYLISDINPKIVKFLLSIDVDPKAFADKFLRDQGQIIQLFQSMPTSYNVVELSFRRDMLTDRKVHPHDLNDIMSLSIALPYSDVVVTERMWHTIILQAKLDKLRPTRVLKSVRDLSPILKSL